MYHFAFELKVFSSSFYLENVLKNNVIPDKFSFTARTFPFSEFFSLKAGEKGIIILDIPKALTLGADNSLLDKCVQLIKACKQIKIIFYMDHAQLLQIPSELLPVISEIWSAPLTESLLHFHFKNFIQKMKEEKDLWMAENYLDTTINSIPDLIWYKDIKGSHLKVNDGFCKAVGKTKEDCEGRGHYYIWDLKREEYEKGEYVCLETEEIVLKEKKTCLFDEQVKSKDGMRQFKTYKSPLFDDEHNVIGTVGIAHDVTDFGNINTELEIILGSLPFAALITDVDGKIVNVNEKFLEYFQITREKILYSDYPEFREKVSGIDSLDNKQRNITICMKYHAQDLMLEMQETIIYDVFQNIVGSFCIYRDITEHVKHLDFMKNYQKHLESDVKEQVKLNQVFQKNMLISFADIISSRDNITGGHIKRTSKYVELLVNAMIKENLYGENMDESFIEHMYLSAPLHDIGKISIPGVVLLKPGKYTSSEYEIMKMHANLGGEILDTIMPDLNDSEYYHLSKDMAECHHERWDGTGYPHGMKGEEIPLCARIMAVADVFDALTSRRPYKEAFPLEEARKIIENGKGTHFDPAIVDVFIKHFSEIEATVNELDGGVCSVGL